MYAAFPSHSMKIRMAIFSRGRKGGPTAFLAVSTAGLVAIAKHAAGAENPTLWHFLTFAVLGGLICWQTVQLFSRSEPPLKKNAQEAD